MQYSLKTLLTTTILVLSSSSATPLNAPGHWEVLPQIPSFPRQEHTTLALQNSIYILAGVHPNDTNPAQTTTLMQRYSIPTKQWETRSFMPLALNHANVAVVHDKIYVLGGLSELTPELLWDALPDCSVYDPKSDKWTVLPPMPASQARGSAAVGVHGTKIYLAGGLRSLALYEGGVQDTVADVTVYDTATMKWEVLPSLSEGRDHAAAAVIGNVFYVLGGRFRGQVNVRGTVFALNLQKPRKGWKTLASMPTPRGGVASGVIGEKVYVFGGEGNPAEGSKGVFNETEVFDTQRNSWKKLSPMKVARHGTSSVGVKGKIYIPGGGLEQGGVGMVDYFDAFVPGKSW